MPGATKTIVINAPIEKVYATITDYDKYPQFLTEAKSVKATRKTPDSVEVEWKIDVIKTITYTLLMKEEKPNKISWTFVKGEVMKDNRGSWLLEKDGEERTRATYTADLTLGGFVPGAIVKALVEKQLPTMLEAFKKRSEGR